MFSFANPFFLFGLPILALALWVHLRGLQNRRASLLYPQVGALSLLKAAGEARLLRHLPALLRAAALSLALIALARPQKVLKQGLSEVSGIDIILCLDTSGSMQALDFAPKNRLEAALETAREFIQNRVHDRIGVVVFAANALLQCPPTLDYEALLEFLSQVEIGMTQSDGTAVGDALAAALNHLKDSTARSKVVILLTDGRNNSGILDPLTAARTAQALGVKVYTIGTGARGPALFPVDDPFFGRKLVQLPEELDESTLAAMAALTQGRYFRATNLKELKEIYRQIDQMEKTKIQAPDIFSRHDLYAYFLIPALFLLLGELVLSRTYLLKIP